MQSMYWTDEEAQYMKAVFSWQAKTDGDRASWAASRSLIDLTLQGGDAASGTEKKPPAGEFRILVVGAKGTGKTSILTRFCAKAFRGESEPADPQFGRGCRHHIELLSDDEAGSQQQQQPTKQTSTAKNSTKSTYVVDVLEMPSRHLSSNLMLEQALNITEGAVLVYDVADAASLRLAVRVHDFIRDSLLAGGGGNSNDAATRRDYALLLVGHKSDVDDEDRAVPWAEGSRTAAGFRVRCGFVEASAKTGDNISIIFPTLGREILRIKKLARQRREAERTALLLRLKAQTAGGDVAGGPAPVRRRSIWRVITRPFARRRDGQVQT